MYFDSYNVLNAKIDTLTAMMNNLNTQNMRQSKPFKAIIDQGKMKGQDKNKNIDRGR